MISILLNHSVWWAKNVGTHHKELFIIGDKTLQNCPKSKAYELICGRTTHNRLYPFPDFVLKPTAHAWKRSIVSAHTHSHKYIIKRVATAMPMIVSLYVCVFVCSIYKRRTIVSVGLHVCVCARCIYKTAKKVRLPTSRHFFGLKFDIRSASRSALC